MSYVVTSNVDSSEHSDRYVGNSGLPISRVPQAYVFPTLEDAKREWAKYPMWRRIYEVRWAVRLSETERNSFSDRGEARRHYHNCKALGLPARFVHVLKRVIP